MYVIFTKDTCGFHKGQNTRSRCRETDRLTESVLVLLQWMYLHDGECVQAAVSDSISSAPSPRELRPKWMRRPAVLECVSVTQKQDLAPNPPSLSRTNTHTYTITTALR